MSDKHVIGICSICGGEVEQYLYLHIVGPFPPATCRSCGATARPSGPVIPMKPKSAEPIDWSRHTTGITSEWMR